MQIAVPKPLPTAADHFDGQRWLKATNLYWQGVIEKLVVALNQVRTDPSTVKAAISAPTGDDERAGVVAKYKELSQ